MTSGERKVVGIIGLGSFGAFIASLLPNNVRVIGYDPRPALTVPGVVRVPFKEIYKADVLIVAVPLEQLSATVKTLADMLRPNTLVIDVCSVKTKPQAIYDTYLPHHGNLLLTHPLFGPQSAANGTKGHRLIVTKSTGSEASNVLTFCQTRLGLDITHMSAEEHDKTMARVHALTFFVARSLSAMGLEDELFMTPSYAMLMDLVRLDRSHSEQLFQTVENGNPFAAIVRRELLKSFEQVEASLKQ